MTHGRVAATIAIVGLTARRGCCFDLRLRLAVFFEIDNARSGALLLTNFGGRLPTIVSVVEYRNSPFGGLFIALF